MGLRRYANGTPPLRQGYQQRGQPQRYHAGRADVAQLVERVHGKDEVAGSTPAVGSLFLPQRHQQFGIVFCSICPLLSAERKQRITNQGAENGVLPKRRAPLDRLLTMDALYRLSYVGLARAMLPARRPESASRPSSVMLGLPELALACGGPQGDEAGTRLAPAFGQSSTKTRRWTDAASKPAPSALNDLPYES